jgi:large subunit ribosomal protein L3
VPKNIQTPGLSSVLAYKAGMTQLITVDESESPTKNQEVSRACTVLEYPQTVLYGVRLYKKNPDTKYENASTEVYDAESAKKMKLQNAKNNGKINDYKDKISEYSDIAALLVAYPKTTAMSKNHQERFEARVTGKDIKEKFDFVASHLGKEVKIPDVFKKGEDIDLMAVTKGKGWQGPIKRLGVVRLFHKATQKQRHVGTLGAFGLGKVAYTVPHAGQTGYGTRTEHNKRILQIGTKETVSAINQKAGFSNYGPVRNDYLVVDGSVPGPAKRVIRVRKAVRSHQKPQSIKDPRIIEITIK